jgi:type IV pilus assembly protein PilA
MNCPYCSAVISDDIRFCPKCGTEMGSPLPGSPAYQGPLPPGFEPPTSGKAIGSLVSGLLFFFAPFSSIVAVILGHISLSEIRKSSGRLKGHGMATAGLVLGYIGIAAIPFILIIAAIAIPNLIRAKIAANEAAAVGSLRTYNTAMVTYAANCPSVGYPASTAQLGPGEGGCTQAGLVTSRMAVPRSVKSGYIFIYQPMVQVRGRITQYAISADPVQPGTTGTRHFYTDETGIIRYDMNNGATATSPPL